MRRSFLLLLVAVLPAAAQQVDDPANLMGERVAAPALVDTLPINHGPRALEQLLRKLRTRASMMLIVAHPDDEDGGLLTYESRGQGARVAMLTLTRGEGGQNLMSADFNDALGLIRTQELLAADRYMGVDQFFGTEVDFGFSKTKEETLKQWGHERVLYDAVRAVRLYRPLVIASVFVGGVTDGHGQHQVSGEIAQEVFVAAANPKVFPEMGLPPWAPLKVYARTPFAPVSDKGMFDYATGRYSPTRFHNYVTGRDIDHEPAATVTVHEGEKPAIAAFGGMTFVQFARQGLAMQKSQIGNGVRVPPAGLYDVGYTRMGSRLGRDFSDGPKQERELFEGVDTSLAGIAGLAPDAPASLRAGLAAVDAKVTEAQRAFDPVRPEAIAPQLHDGLRVLDGLIASVEKSGIARAGRFNVLHELRVKRVQMNDALVLAYGLRVTAVAEDRAAGAGQPSFRVRVTERQVSGQPLALAATCWEGAGGEACKPAESGQAAPAETELGPLKAGPTRPYFSRPGIAQPFYDVSSKDLRNAPATPAPFAAKYVFKDREVPLEVMATVAYPDGSPLAGQAVAVVPPVSVGVMPRLGIIRPGDHEIGLHAAVEGGRGGTVMVKVPAGWTSRPAQAAFPASGADGLRFTVSSPQGAGSEQVISLDAVSEGKHYAESYRAVGYPGLTFTNFYTPATFKASAVDVRTAPGLRVGYLAGTGDDTAGALGSLGLTPTMLTAAELTGPGATAKLRKFDVVVLGVRAYSAHPELSGTGSAPLIDFARAGGVVITQYNSGGFDPRSAPFPFSLPGDSAHNVVDEDQPVRLLVPDAALLSWPNQLTAHDFDHWVEERGHGFASEWAPEYKPLLETHDLEQDPQRGGLLVAQVGRGAYVYCALALYRQLPEGVPGAYRLLANLVSYAKNPARASK